MGRSGFGGGDGGKWGLGGGDGGKGGGGDFAEKFPLLVAAAFRPEAYNFSLFPFSCFHVWGGMCVTHTHRHTTHTHTPHTHTHTHTAHIIQRPIPHCELYTGKTVSLIYPMHCPKNNLNLRFRACHGWSRCNGVYLIFDICARYIVCAQKPNIY